MTPDRRAAQDAADERIRAAAREAGRLVVAEVLRKELTRDRRPRGMVLLGGRLLITTHRQPDGAPRIDSGLSITASGATFGIRAIRLGRHRALVLGWRRP